MKGFLRSKLVLSLVTVVMIAAAVLITVSERPFIPRQQILIYTLMPQQATTQTTVLNLLRLPLSIRLPLWHKNEQRYKLLQVSTANLLRPIRAASNSQNYVDFRCLKGSKIGIYFYHWQGASLTR